MPSVCFTVAAIVCVFERKTLHCALAALRPLRRCSTTQDAESFPTIKAPLLCD